MKKILLIALLALSASLSAQHVVFNKMKFNDRQFLGKTPGTVSINDDILIISLNKKHHKRVFDVKMPVEHFKGDVYISLNKDHLITFYKNSVSVTNMTINGNTLSKYTLTYYTK